MYDTSCNSRMSNMVPIKLYSINKENIHNLISYNKMVLVESTEWSHINTLNMSFEVLMDSYFSNSHDESFLFKNGYVNKDINTAYSDIILELNKVSKDLYAVSNIIDNLLYYKNNYYNLIQENKYSLQDTKYLSNYIYDIFRIKQLSSIESFEDLYTIYDDNYIGRVFSSLYDTYNFANASISKHINTQDNINLNVNVNFLI